MTWKPVDFEPKFAVKGATPACCNEGCQAPALAALSRRLSEHAHEVLETLEKKEGLMQPTRALWCEQGGHPFSEKDPDIQVLTIAGRGPDGQPVEESRTSCGECAAIAKTRLGKAHQQAIRPAAE